MNHRLFIIRLLEILSRGKERICIGVSDEFSDGKIELRPCEAAGGEIHGHFQGHSDSTGMGFYKLNPEMIIHGNECRKELCLDTVYADSEKVFVASVYDTTIELSYDDFEYDESMGIISRKPL
ncbi:hypothetical protein [Gimesia fumaroli]|uniref:Uncharacterized protein n=1 Tax=Gimesia fumaroli TaxID=2527976 RepID=A0A518I8W2_9PLAN|nr:hypothetical protein [Gimesia fumaroli]QDV49553.1 hypothetical protein Enr17x_15730 [Gimesia fumaroli]